MKLLNEVTDPEFGIGLVDLGLIYNVKIENKEAIIDMTLTTPTCPYSGLILNNIREKLEQIEELETITVNLVWDPPWTPDRLSEKARIMLNYK